MPQKIRMWEVTSEDKLQELTSDGIDLENRLEDWLVSDISILDPNLMIIGRQVRTDFGGEVDLLCLDSTGSLVVVELKKGKTPREVTAQALDYASWVKDLSFQEIESLAEQYLKDSLDKSYSDAFGQELPETFDHRSLVVAEEMDASTERIVRYLSDMNVPINVATVKHAKANDGREILAQVYLVEPEAAAAKASVTSKRRGYALISEIQAVADNNNVGDLYQHLRSQASGKLTSSTIGHNFGFHPPSGSGNHQALFIVHPGESSRERGLRFRLNGTRLANFFGLDADKIKDALPAGYDLLPHDGWGGTTQEEKGNWNGYQGYSHTTGEIDKLLTVIPQ